MRCSSDEISEVAEKLTEIARSCRLCPRECGVNRTNDERGYCGAGLLPSVSSIVKHFGEEPPLVGEPMEQGLFFSHIATFGVYSVRITRLVEVLSGRNTLYNGWVLRWFVFSPNVH